LAIFWNLRIDWVFSGDQNDLKNILNILNQCRNSANENSLVQAAKAKIQEEFSKIDTNETIRETESQIKIWLENLPVLPIQVEMSYKFDDFYFQSFKPYLAIRELAKNRKWKEKGVIWFAYINHSTRMKIPDL
jgi:hypothetical protein